MMKMSNKQKMDKVENQTLGKKIAFFRKEKGMTQKMLGEEMGVTAQAVSKWERDLSWPDKPLLPKLAKVFGVSLDELLQEKDRDSSLAPSGMITALETLSSSLQSLQKNIDKGGDKRRDE